MSLSCLKKIFLSLCLAIVVNAVQTPCLMGLDVPAKPNSYVTDRAGLLSRDARLRLENALRQFEQQTSDQIVVATFPSLEGEALEDFSIRLAEAWQIGQKNKDNGVILLVFKKEHKIRIEVGYGLEGALTDAESSLIINQVITPYFKKDQYDQGLTAGVAAIMKAVKGEFQAGSSRYSGSSGQTYRQLSPEDIAAIKRKSRVMGIFILLAAALLFIVDLARYGQYASSHRNYQQRYSFWEWFFRFALLLAVVSIIFRILFYMMLFSRGGYGGSRGGGGFSSGGGSFGGGGASGGW